MAKAQPVNDPSQGLRMEHHRPDATPDKRRHEKPGKVARHENRLLGQGTLFEDGGAQGVPMRLWNRHRVGKGDRVSGLTTGGDRVVVDLRDMSITVNGTPRPHPPAMLHDCESMQSLYDSGRITIRPSAGAVTCDGTK